MEWPPQELETLCQMTRTEDLPSTTNLPHTRTVPPPRATGKKITRPDTSIPNKHQNMPIRLFSGRRKLLASPRSQQESHKGVDPREGRQFGSYAESRAGELGGEVKCNHRETPASRNALVRSGATYETDEPYVFSPWWFQFRSQPGRQGFALQGQAKYLQARGAGLHAFLHSIGRGAAQHPDERPTGSSYRHPGRA